MLDAFRTRETWLGTRATRRRWLAIGVVVGLVVGAFNVPATAFVLADVGLPVGWGVAGYGYLASFLVAAGSGYDRAGAFVGVAATAATTWWWALPGITFGVPAGPMDPVAVIGGVAASALVVGTVGYLIGAGARRLVDVVRDHRARATSASKN